MTSTLALCRLQTGFGELLAISSRIPGNLLATSSQLPSNLPAAWHELHPSKKRRGVFLEKLQNGFCQKVRQIERPNIQVTSVNVYDLLGSFEKNHSKI